MRDRARGLRGRQGRRHARVLRDQAGREDPRIAATPYICVLEIELHLGESFDLKQKRKHVKSLKEQMRHRFGASVAEIDHHDKWQRATLLCALVGSAEVRVRADDLQRFIESRCPDGCSFRRETRTLADLRD